MSWIKHRRVDGSNPGLRIRNRVWLWKLYHLLSVVGKPLTFLRKPVCLGGLCSPKWSQADQRSELRSNISPSECRPVPSRGLRQHYSSAYSSIYHSEAPVLLNNKVQCGTLISHYTARHLNSYRGTYAFINNIMLFNYKSISSLSAALPVEIVCPSGNNINSLVLALVLLCFYSLDPTRVALLYGIPRIIDVNSDS